MAQAQKVALVTGASAGIGRACAERLSTAGWVVVGSSRRGTGGSTWPGIVMDVDDDVSVRDGVAGVLAEHGRLDALVTAAGWGLAGAVEHTTIDEAKAQVETLFWGSVRCAQAVLPAMRGQGGGRLVFLSSIGGLIAIPFQGFYCAAKFALEGLAEAMAYEVAPFGVQVTLVEPGNVATEFTDARRRAAAADDDPAYRGALDKAIGVMEHDERNGVAPDAVAACVERILQAAHPPRRVSVGKNGERIGLLAKRLMPFGLFERAARSSLGV